MTHKHLVSTAYGILDSVALEQVRSNYDTTRLLEAVQALDLLMADFSGQTGLRDQLLRLHAMAHVVVNGSSLRGNIGQENLPELAEDLTDQLRSAIQILEGCVLEILPLLALQARD